MKRRHIILLLLSFMILSWSVAYAADPPHSPEMPFFKTDKCLGCHGSANFGTVADQVGTSIDNTTTTLMCRACHKDGGGAANALSHSSLTTSENKGTWSAGCSTCHDPHYQAQYKTWGAESFLSSGTVQSVVGNVITVSGVDWSPGIWITNSYIVVPNTKYGAFTYKITDNTNNTLTVQGPLQSRYITVGGNLGIFYGKLIKSSIGIGKLINGTYTKPVKLFNSTGPFSTQASSTNANDKALCVVCHTKTTYMNIASIYNGNATSHNSGDSRTCFTDTSGCHKQHKEGFDTAVAVVCGDCHGNPPLTNTPDAGGLVFKTKYGGAFVDNTTGPVANNMAGGKHDKHVSGRGYGCDACHRGGMWAPDPAPDAQVPDDLKITMGFYLAGDANGIYYGRKGSGANTNLHNGFTYNGSAAMTGDNTWRCTNLYCHSNANLKSGALGGTLFNKSAAWNSASYSGTACNECHSAATDATRNWTTKHDKHAVIYNANSLYNCNACHSTVAANNNGISTQGNHVNRSINVVFNGVNPSALAYNGPAYQCSNLYCHSNANPLGGTMAYIQPKWNDAPYNATDCNQCHTNAAASSGWSSAHTKHAGVGAGRYAYTCDECHADVSPNNSNALALTAASYSKHVNNAKDVKFSTTLRSTNINQSGYGYVAASYTCTTTYCHSAGVSKTSPFTSPVTVAWNDTLSADCSGCHQAKATLNTRSHQAHLTGSYAYQCGKCHASVSNLTNDLLINAPALHVDGGNQVAWDSMNQGASAYNVVGTGSCSNIYCHSLGTKSAAPYGAATTVAVWGNAAFPSSECTGCHGGDASASGTKMYRDAHRSHIDNASVLGTNYTCQDCHAATVIGNRTMVGNHVESTKTVNIAFIGRNAVGATYNSAATPRALPAGHTEAKTCSGLYCHSDGKNSYRSIAWNGAAIGCNGCHGTSNTQGMPDYPNQGAGLQNANSHSGSTHMGSKCDTCHTGVVPVNSNSPILLGSTLHINNVINVNMAPVSGAWNAATKSCLNTSGCHGGDEIVWGGAALGCTTCHESSQALAALHGKHYNSPTDGGLGGQNLSDSLRYIYNCGNCHKQATSHPPASGGYADVVFNLDAWAPAPYNAGGYSYAGTNTTDSKGVYYSTYGTCSNTYCHSTGQTYTGTPVYNTVGWGDSNALGCNYCHRADRNNLTTNKHAKHIAGTSPNYNYACMDCHSNVLFNDTTIADKSLHVNFSKTVVWNATLGGGSNYGTAGTGSCSNIYCHSMGTTATAPFTNNVLAAWNGTGFPTDCTGCHGAGAGQGTKVATNRHTSHINNAGGALGLNISCDTCHASVLIGNTTVGSTMIGNHVNKMVNVRFTGGLNSVGFFNGSQNSSRAPGNSANAQCSNLYCHSDGNINTGGASARVTYRNVAWNGAAIGCSGCHGDGGSVVYPTFANTGANLVNSNSHSAHVTGSNIGCVSCHRDTTLDGTSVNTTSGLHIDGTESVVFSLLGGKTGTYNSSNKTCSTTYCHGAFTPPAVAWGGSTNCGSCHEGNKNLAGSHPVHVNTTGLANSTDLSTGALLSNSSAYIYACANCHPATHTDGPVSANNQDAQISFANMTFAVSNTGGAYTAAGVNTVDSKGFNWRTAGTCSTNYCHSAAKPVTGTGAFARSNFFNVPTWNSGSLSCTSCHDGPRTTSSGWSKAHDVHVDATGGAYSYTCANCHVDTASSNTAVSNSAKHVNNSKDVAFDAVLAKRDGYNATYNKSNYNCSNNYCHSQGYTVANSTVAGSYPNTVIWNSSTMTCGSCHGDSQGYPSNVNGVKWNSHQVSDHKVVCSTCHRDVTAAAANTIIAANATWHVNGAYNVSSAGFTYVYRAMPNKGTCSNISCHGGAGVHADWGATLTCENCHVRVGMDQDSIYSGSFWDNGSMALINSAEWTSTGHGKTSGNYGSGNAAANKACTACHSAGVQHKVSTNPFRLMYLSTVNATWSWNWNCTVCHATGQPNKAGGGSDRKVDSRHYGAKHTATFNGGQLCWDCHDPHGDGNRYMIHARVHNTSNMSTGVATNTVTTTVVFTANATGTDYAKSASPYNGVCQVCHTSAGHYTATSGDNHNFDKRCTSCHGHTKTGDINAGFSGAGGESSGGTPCNTCHGDLYLRMHNNTANMVYKHFMQNDNAGPGNYLVNASIGASVSHVLSNSQSSTTRNCQICHVDHGIFSGNDANNKRAGNLRTSLAVTPTTTVGFANTDFLGDRPDGGLCLSCHRKQQKKAVSTNNGVQNVPAVPYPTEADSSVAPTNSNGIVRNSTHNYSVQSGVFGDGSKFQAVCTKCHNDTIGGTGDKSSVAGQTADPKFGLHQGGRNSFLAVMGTGNFKDFQYGKITAVAGTTITVDQDLPKDYTSYALVVTNPSGVSQRAIITATDTALEQLSVAAWPIATPAVNDTFEVVRNITSIDEVCFNCHSTSANGYKPYNGRDFYNAATMSPKLEGIYNLFNADKGAATATDGRSTITDSTKNWTSSWVGYYVVIKSGTNAGKRAKITANTTTQITFSPAFANNSIKVGDQYEITKPATHPIDKGGNHKPDEHLSATVGWNAGMNLNDNPSTTRHVSCADCHNTHAAQVNPNGIANAFASTTVLKDAAKTYSHTGWANDKWSGYLMVFTNSSTVRIVRPIVSSITNSADTTYILALPAPQNMNGRTYEVLRHDGLTGSGGKGVFGVQVTGYSTQTPGNPGLQTLNGGNFVKKYDVGGDMGRFQADLCVKCHSFYSWGAGTIPNSPSGHADASAVAQTDVASEFNPNNLAHHAVYAVGNNQPHLPNGIANATFPLNTNWKSVTDTSNSVTDNGTYATVTGFSTLPVTALPGWYVRDNGDNKVYQITKILSTTSFEMAATNGNPWDPNKNYVGSTGTRSLTVTPGLGDAFVPPYGPWSIMRCTDCHGSTLSDPLGPHASVNKWLIKDAEQTLKFEWWNGSSLTTIVYNTTTADYSNTAFETKYFCYNCHRADVYPTKNIGTLDCIPANAPLSRIRHGNSDGTPKAGGPTGIGLWNKCSGRMVDETRTNWPQYCRQCHGGDRLGGIHGTNLSKRNSGSSTNNAGKRFLNGASWDSSIAPSVGAGGNCYTVATNDARVTTCAQHGSASGSGDTTSRATYDY